MPSSPQTSKTEEPKSAAICRRSSSASPSQPPSLLKPAPPAPLPAAPPSASWPRDPWHHHVETYVKCREADTMVQHDLWTRNLNLWTEETPLLKSICKGPFVKLLLRGVRHSHRPLRIAKVASESGKPYKQAAQDIGPSNRAENLLARVPVLGSCFLHRIYRDWAVMFAARNLLLWPPGAIASCRGQHQTAQSSGPTI